MRVNPGGYIAPKEVIGRDALIRNIWEILDRQSVVITAERRIGKTCVIKKMHAESPADWFPVFQDLERIHSAAEFAQEVFETVQSFLGRWKQAADRAKQFLEGRDVKIGGVEIGGRHERPWKTLLIHSIADLVDAKSNWWTPTIRGNWPTIATASATTILRPTTANLSSAFWTNCP